VKIVAHQTNRTSKFRSFENLQVRRTGLLDVAAYGLDSLGCPQSLVDGIEIFLQTALKIFVRDWGKKQSNFQKFLSWEEHSK
jgi:hypothetical protein